MPKFAFSTMARESSNLKNSDVQLLVGTVQHMKNGLSTGVIKSAEIEIEIADRDSGTVLVSRQTNKNFPQMNKNFQTN